MNKYKKYTLLHEEVRTVIQTVTINMSRLDQLLPPINKIDNNIKQSADSGDPNGVLPIINRR